MAWGRHLPPDPLSRKRSWLFPASLPIFLFDDLAHRCRDLAHRGGGAVPASPGPQGCGLAGGGPLCCARSDFVRAIRGGVAGDDAQIRGGGNGILIRPKKEELPFVHFSLVFDHGGDLFPSVSLGSILKPIGQDRHDHLPRPLRFRRLLQPLAEPINGLADGVQQGGAAAGDVGVGVEPDGFRNGNVVHRDEIFVVEKNQREPGLAGSRLLVAKEFVESRDSGLGDGLHGTGTVENEGDFSEVFVHVPIKYPRQGHLWSLCEKFKNFHPGTADFPVSG